MFNMKKLLIATLALGGTQAALADMYDSTIGVMRQQLSCYTLDCGHWYAGANLGMSHLHDKKNPGSTNSVDQNGPGGSAQLGYQFNSVFGLELGYTQYKNSRETNGGFVIARTDHYAVDLAATGRVPLVYQFSAIGKLGAAYSYAQKIAEATGAASSSGAGSLYWGLGLDYSVTHHADIIIQFAEAVGNKYTGSADLWSIGVNYAFA
jgi:hypothetical protein